MEPQNFTVILNTVTDTDCRVVGCLSFALRIDVCKVTQKCQQLIICLL